MKRKKSAFKGTFCGREFKSNYYGREKATNFHYSKTLIYFSKKQKPKLQPK